MKKLSTLMLLTTFAGAEAAPISIRSLITGSGGQMTISQGFFLVSKRTSDLTYLTLGVGAFDLTNAGRLNGVAVIAVKEYLKPSERALFNRAVGQVATRCFNLRPERLTAISVWLDRQNSSAIRDVATDFGPMRLRFLRDINEDGNFYTSVYLNRTGTPGVLPWKSYCTP
ncbi:hypothetical protein [Deinococcus sp. QL22]|uniref:hypothetical protein n=1 Tax=Deinococcus sp. QL22 TaxID=2939437 RepID=UPI002017539C|nr:hypothetical protein [Deinococcus sp. QL22]UQN05508.1 hypothetical protein M1R55_11540 [Deinococcus sp. QL22]